MWWGHSRILTNQNSPGTKCKKVACAGLRAQGVKCKKVRARRVMGTFNQGCAHRVLSAKR